MMLCLWHSLPDAFLCTQDFSYTKLRRRRALRNQQFIQFTKRDIAEREAKTRGAAEAYWEAHPRHKLPQVRWLTCQ